MGRVVALAAVFLFCCLEGCLAAPSPAANSTAPGHSSDGSIMQTPQIGYLGCHAELYADGSFGGAKKDILGRISCLDSVGFNDKVSSAKIIGTCDWLFYTDCSFGADTAVLTPGNYGWVSDWGQGNDILSSLRPVPPSGTVAIVLYEHSNYEGRELVLYVSVDSLSNFNDITSSVAVTGGSWQLYKDTGHQGNSVTVGVGYTNTPGGNDYISSVKRL